MRIINISIALAAALALSGCKLFVAVGIGGNVTGSDGNNCSESSLCEIEITDATFNETFTAVPKAGFRFRKWEEGDGYLCGNQTSASCTLDNTFASGNASLEAVIASDRSFAIRPIFEPVSGFLGVTSSSYDGSVLISGWTAACQADYGSSAAVCTSKQILLSPDLVSISLPASAVWIRGEPQGGENSGYVDYSGTVFGSSSRAYCYRSAGELSAVINQSLRVGGERCDISRPIACCRP